jgi:plasmid stability protein
MTRTIQIRDVTDSTYTVLRTRAAAEHLSLTAYLRRELDNLAHQSDLAGWIHEATNREWGVSRDVIVRTAREVRDEENG